LNKNETDLTIWVSFYGDQTNTNPSDKPVSPWRVTL